MLFSYIYELYFYHVYHPLLSLATLLMISFLFSSSLQLSFAYLPSITYVSMCLCVYGSIVFDDLARCIRFVYRIQMKDYLQEYGLLTSNYTTDQILCPSVTIKCL